MDKKMMAVGTSMHAAEASGKRGYVWISDDKRAGGTQRKRLFPEGGDTVPSFYIRWSCRVISKALNSRLQPEGSGAITALPPTEGKR